MNYPADKEDLVKHAEQQGADEDVLEVLRRISEREYAEVNYLLKAALQQVSEARLTALFREAAGELMLA